MDKLCYKLVKDKKCIIINLKMFGPFCFELDNQELLISTIVSTEDKNPKSKKKKKG